VHAGEWTGPDAVREVLDALRPDRIDHGVAAAADSG
jgi:adenosine deaminase